jgi:hypothetical protein
MSRLSDEQKDAYREELVGKIVELMKADSASAVRVASRADDDGVAFTLRIPRGSTELAPHIRELAAVIAQRQV